MTNYEAIKAMGINELADLLGGITSCCDCPVYPGNGDDNEEQTAFYLEWLNEESNDDTVVEHSDGQTINISHANVVTID